MRPSGLCLHLVSVLALSASTPASPLQGRSTIPPGWSLHRRADLDATIPLKVALVQPNLNNLDAYLLDTADPASPNYGKHWTREEVIEAFRPSSESVKTVHSWLIDDHGVDTARIRLGQGLGALHLDVTVAEAEDILATEYYVFRHTDGTERVGVHQSYDLPEHVSKHVDLIWPTLHFGGAPVRRRRNAHAPIPVSTSGKKGLVLVNNDARHCDTAVTLECLRQLYNFNYTLASRDKNSIAVGDYAGQSYKGRDLDLLFQLFSPNQVGRQPTLVSIAGGQLNDTSNDVPVIGESNMDFQLIMGLLPLHWQEALWYQVGQSSEPIAVLMTNYLERWTVRIVSKSRSNLTDCGNKPLAHVLSLSYATSPDVNDPQIAAALARQCAEIGKGWQDKQVTDYLAKYGPAHPTAVVVAGNFVMGGGTSASAPIVASLIAAVNDARIARGKGPVGWINPAMNLLYSEQFKGVFEFNDVTNGTNPGCGTPGFQTAPGWDPVTGLGTLNFKRLLEQFLALP